MTFKCKYQASGWEEAVPQCLTFLPISQVGTLRPLLAREPGPSLTTLILRLVINTG